MNTGVTQGKREASLLVRADGRSILGKPEGSDAERRNRSRETDGGESFRTWMDSYMPMRPSVSAYFVSSAVERSSSCRLIPAL